MWTPMMLMKTFSGGGLEVLVVDGIADGAAGDC
jgi:hypothetical protein